MKDIKLEASALTKKVKSALDNLDVCNSKASQTMKEMKAMLLERVKSGFQEIKQMIAEKEQDIVYQIHSYFYHQERKLSNIVGDASNARKNLQSYVSDLDNILKREDLLKEEKIFQNIQDQLANYQTEVDFQVIDRKSEEIRSKMEDILQSLKEFQGSQKHVWSELKLSLKRSLFNNLALGALKDLPPQSSNINTIQMEIEEDPFVFKVSVPLSFKYREEELAISTKELSEENIIDIEKWKNTKSVILFLSHNIAEEDLQMLAFILRKVEAHGYLSLRFNSSGLCQKTLESLAQSSFSFSKIEMQLQKLDLTAESTSLLLGRILSQCKNIEETKFFLSEAKLSKHALQEFLEDIVTNRVNIQHMILDLKNTNVSDDDICQFSLNLPCIKGFHLILHHTKVTDHVVEWLGKNLFTPMSCLETFTLSLSGIQITDAYMETLFSGFRKIRNLILDLANTKITNKTLKALSQTMATIAGGLESFIIHLNGTHITDEAVPLMFMSLPNVIRLGLVLPGIKITDKTIELLAQKTLSSANKLNRLTLFLSNSAVTDKSIRQLFEVLPKLKMLKLRLDSTEVTDISIAPFIIDKVPAMEGLSKFEMTTSNTKVSPEVQAKIQELEKTFNSDS